MKPGTLPLKSERIEDLFRYIARGLAWHHWGVYLNTESDSVASMISAIGGESFLDEVLFRLEGRAHVQEDLGDKTFLYEGKQGKDNPAITIWRFLIYGGLTMGDPERPARLVVAITGPTARIKWITGQA